MQQHERIFQRGDLFLGVVDEVRRQVAAIELHTFHDFQFAFQASAVFHGDHAFFADFVHRISNDVADGAVGVGGDAAHLSDFFIGGARLGDFFQLFNCCDHRFVDTALEIHWIHTGGDIFHAFFQDCLSQHSRGGGAVASDVGSLGSNFFHHLRAHVFELVFEFDFFSNRYTVLGDGRRAEGAIQHHVAAFRAQGDFYRISQYVDADYHFVASDVAKFYVFSSH